ncbi:uncharacterized protein DSM5745_09500 [Aspergillus mulundensis]|uniref:Uncharacterized protein n=1 Tax=Aspergillus mulundensis TaxID=1810919 RepID=A0A3D8QVP1_9EURO|nr:hypothetical protein DSM5745_09500 [Aspergillus mulundensis]RDW65761.1 hypothetical protein DSM5745_09500 [Aspergillus mulundensis]
MRKSPSVLHPLPNRQSRKRDVPGERRTLQIRVRIRPSHPQIRKAHVPQFQELGALQRTQDDLQSAVEQPHPGKRDALQRCAVAQQERAHLGPAAQLPAAEVAAAQLERAQRLRVEWRDAAGELHAVLVQVHVAVRFGPLCLLVGREVVQHVPDVSKVQDQRLELAGGADQAVDVRFLSPLEGHVPAAGELELAEIRPHGAELGVVDVRWGQAVHDDDVEGQRELGDWAVQLRQDGHEDEVCVCEDELVVEDLALAQECCPAEGLAGLRLRFRVRFRLRGRIRVCVWVGGAFVAGLADADGGHVLEPLEDCLPVADGLLRVHEAALEVWGGGTFEAPPAETRAEAGGVFDSVAGDGELLDLGGEVGVPGYGVELLEGGAREVGCPVGEVLEVRQWEVACDVVQELCGEVAKGVGEVSVGKIGHVVGLVQHEDVLFEMEDDEVCQFDERSRSPCSEKPGLSGFSSLLRLRPKRLPEAVYTR